jgi:hypothetical protein
MPFTLQPTQFAVKNGQRIIIQKNPYIRISRDGYAIHIQGGQVYDAGGKRLNDLPEWFQDEIKKISPEGLDRVGWKEHRKVGRPSSKENLEKKLKEDDKEGITKDA